MQRSWNRSAGETCPDLADMMQRLEAKMDRLIALSQQYAKTNKMPGDLAADVVHLPACEAVVCCASTQTNHIMQSETRPGSAAAIEHGLVMSRRHRLRAHAGIVRLAPYV